MIDKTMLVFLNNLRENNNRDWFAEHKAEADAARSKFEQLVETLIKGISEFDPEIASLEAKKCIFRIYRDTRFSNDKTPYKDHFGAVFSSPGMSKSSGYYFHLCPGGSFISCGHYMLPPDQLKLVREHIYDDVDQLEAILHQPEFVARFGGLQTDQKLKRVPAGYDKDHQAAEYVKLKSFYVLRKISDNELAQPSFMEQLLSDFKCLQPLCHYLDEIIREGKN